MDETPERHPQAAEAVFRVLCVDDEPKILNALRRLLQMEGYEVLTALNAAEGLRQLEQTPVDLVISDMRMPDMNGAEFLAEVKARSPDTVRILITGYAELSSTITAINEGEIYRYIAKPWDDALVLRAVGDAAERKRLRQERARLEKLTERQNRQLKELNASLETKVKARTAELEEAHEKLKGSFLTFVKVFSSLIELREGTSGGRSRRVAELARRLAQHMKLSDAEIQEITLAGLLHDIGKLGFPDIWLRKPLNALTPDERTEFKKHPLKAQRALIALEQLRGVGELIRSQAERYDGLGYPDHLSGLGIPLGARILAVVHDYEDAQHGGAGGSPMSRVQAREYIIGRRGTHYDPYVVDSFLDMLRAEGAVAIQEQSLTTAELTPGMTLTRDVWAKDGILLLGREQVLTSSLIAQIRQFERSDGTKLTLYVRAA